MDLKELAAGGGVERSASEGRPPNRLGNDASAHGEEDELGDAAQI